MVGVDSSWPELAIVALLTGLMHRGENVVYEALKGHREARGESDSGRSYGSTRISVMD